MTNPLRRMGVLTLVGLLALLTIVPSFSVVRASQPPISYTYNMIGPNASYAPPVGSPYDYLTVYATGSGSFTCTEYYWEDSILHCTEGTVAGSGSYWIVAPGGTIVDRGTWVKSTFISFTGYGGASPGKQGGFLEAYYVATSNTWGPYPEMYSSLSCTINAPAGAPPAGHSGGPFTEPVGGTIAFHLNS